MIGTNQNLTKVKELAGIRPRELPDELLKSAQPVVLRGLVASWPMARAGLESGQAASSYLRRFYRDATVGAFLGAPDIGGRFFYTDDLSGFNFKPVRVKLDMKATSHSPLNSSAGLSLPV